MQENWSNEYKRSINCESPKGFSQKAHCAARKKRKGGEETKSKSPFTEEKESQKFTKFSHKTSHLKGKLHQLDPNVDLKQLVHHATVQYVDRDADGDVDVYDNLKKKTPDENPTGVDVGNLSKKLIAKQKGELKHTKRGMAYEDLRKWFGDGPEGGWDRYNTKGEKVGKCAREPGEPKPKCLSNEKAARMSKAEIAAAVKRKRKADPVADRPGKGGKPVMSSNNIKEESRNEKRYCMKCKKIETRNECSYGPEMWDKMTVGNFSKPVGPFNEDQEYSMARSELATIEKAVKRLKKKVKNGEGSLEAWVQSKITKAADYIDTAADYLDSGEHEVEESITIEDANGNSFAQIIDIIGPNQMKPIVDEECWKGYKQIGMKKKGKRMVPNCVKESDLSLVEKILLEMEAEVLNEKNVPTNPSLWSKMKAKAKAKFDVYPSAYANGWAAKEYKKAGGGWKSVSESSEPMIDDMYNEFVGEVCPYCSCDPCECEGRDQDNQLEESVRVQSKNGQLISVVVLWRGKTYATRIFFPQLKLPNRKEIADQIQKIYPDCKVVYYKSVEMEPGQPFLHVSEDWQKVNRQDKTDGLSQKAVNAYRRENPGSKLQTAVTEKKPTGKRAERRKSFCRRMKGMKNRLTSAETARDPDSRINKALRRWNCN